MVNGLPNSAAAPEPIGLLKGGFMRGAHDDRRRWIPLFDASYPGACEGALVGAEANQVGDHKVGSRVCRHALQVLDEREVVALVAQHLADEVSYVAVVLDDQDLSYAPDVVELGPGVQI